MTDPDHIIITKLEHGEDGWTANVNGQPFHTLGASGTMSAWVSDDREALPVVRRALLKKVRTAENREAAAREQEAHERAIREATDANFTDAKTEEEVA